MISFFKIYFKWHYIKKKRICDPMEKIWIKKELYILNYEFQKFIPFFSDFYLIFIWFFYLLKSPKRGFITSSDDVVSRPRRRADVAHGTSAWMRRRTEATWQSHGRPTRGAGGADAWQEATRTDNMLFMYVIT